MVARDRDQQQVAASPLALRRPLVTRYVGELIKRWPGLNPDADDDEDDIPWTNSPLINNASGPLFHFGIHLLDAVVAGGGASRRG
ncbi:hypothetical protein [Amycolatopsis sp. lyj-112]|uniref:hypothetical protein n=1 Tax=Amycolatopsis sp. lyj-112 TaxID=2789288 RepID=UPI00397CAD64